MSPNRLAFTLVLGLAILVVGVFTVLKGGRALVDAWRDASSLVEFGLLIISGAPLWACGLVIIGIGNLLALLVWPWLVQHVAQTKPYSRAKVERLREAVRATKDTLPSTRQFDPDPERRRAILAEQLAVLQELQAAGTDFLLEEGIGRSVYEIMNRAAELARITTRDDRSDAVVEDFIRRSEELISLALDFLEQTKRWVMYEP